MGRATIVLRRLKTKGRKKKFLDRPNFYLFFKSLMNLLYLLNIVFPKFDPLTSTGMALCVDIGPKCQNLFSLV
jgi:hypothetical protein